MPRTKTRRTERPGRDTIAKEMKDRAAYVTEMTFDLMSLCHGVSDPRVADFVRSLRSASETMFAIGLDVQFGSIVVAQGPPPKVEPSLFDALPTNGVHHDPPPIDTIPASIDPATATLDQLDVTDSQLDPRGQPISDLDVYPPGPGEPSPPGHLTVGSTPVPITGPMVEDDGQPKRRTPKLKSFDVFDRPVKTEPGTSLGTVEATNRAQAHNKAQERWPDVWPSSIEVQPNRNPITERNATSVAPEPPSPEPVVHEGYWLVEVRGKLASFAVRAQGREAAQRFAESQLGPASGAFTLVRPDDGSISWDKIPVFPAGVQTAEEYLESAAKAENAEPEGPHSTAPSSGVEQFPLWRVELDEVWDRLPKGIRVEMVRAKTPELAIEQTRNRYPKYRKAKLVAVPAEGVEQPKPRPVPPADAPNAVGDVPTSIGGKRLYYIRLGTPDKPGDFLRACYATSEAEALKHTRANSIQASNPSVQIFAELAKEN